MTFRDLKFLEKNDVVNNSYSQEIIKLNYERFAIFHNKLFWISDIKEHKAEDRRTKGNCCFNHIIGLRRKDRIVKPIFDYEQTLVNA